MSVRVFSLRLFALNLLLWAWSAGAAQPTVVRVNVEDPGALPSDTNSQVATPVARLLGQIPGVTQFEIESAAGDVIRAMKDAEKLDVKRDGEAPKLEEFRIAVRNDVPIRLKDVGRIEELLNRTDGFATADGRPAVLLALSTRRGSITRALLEKELVRLRPTLPPGIHATLAADLSAPGIVLIDVAMPHGTSAGQTRRSAQQVSDAVREIDAHTKCLLFAPADDTTFRVLVGSGDHPADLARLRSRLLQLKDARLRMCPIGGAGSLTPFPVRVALVGFDQAALRRWSDAVRTRLMTENTVIDPDLFPAPQMVQPKVKFVDPIATRMSLPTTDLEKTIVLASRRAVTVYPSWTQTLEIRLERKEGDNPLADIELRTDDGKTVPLASVAKFSLEEEPTAVLTVGTFPAVRLSAAPLAPATSASAAAKCIAAAKTEQEALKLSKEEFYVIDLTDPAD